MSLPDQALWRLKAGDASLWGTWRFGATPGQGEHDPEGWEGKSIGSGGRREIFPSVSWAICRHVGEESLGGRLTQAVGEQIWTPPLAGQLPKGGSPATERSASWLLDCGKARRGCSQLKVPVSGD